MRRLADWLTEAVMGFLALAAMVAAIAPVLFMLSPAAEVAFDLVGWVVVGLFALEYAAHLAVAEDRGAFVRDPWRIVDAVILLTAVGSLLPMVSDKARWLPALRVLRLLRVVLFATRMGHGMRRPAVPPPRPAPEGPPEVTVLAPGDDAPRAGRWDDIVNWAASPTGSWLHASNLPPERLFEAATAAGVPHVIIEAALHESSYPRLESGERWTALTVSVPAPAGDTHRDPVLLLVTEHNVLSLSLHPLDLQRAPVGHDGASWGARCALDVVRRTLDRNEAFAGRLERAVRGLEELPADESPDTFFKQTFLLKRVLSTAKGDLWRLHGLLEMLVDGRRRLPGLAAGQLPQVRELAEEADYLYETVDDIREAVLSLIDLHINVAAHDMNRFMRLLAIVSALALIPAIAGGLLGMNLVDSPWNVTLGQVAFGTFVVMLAVLYTFMAKGWLRH